MNLIDAVKEFQATQDKLLKDIEFYKSVISKLEKENKSLSNKRGREARRMAKHYISTEKSYFNAQIKKMEIDCEFKIGNANCERDSWRAACSTLERNCFDLTAEINALRASLVQTNKTLLDYKFENQALGDLIFEMKKEELRPLLERKNEIKNSD